LTFLSKSKSFQGMMSGLSPDALCRLQIFIWSIRISNVKSDIHFDAIKNYVVSGTVCTKPLRMCSFRQQR